MSETVVAGGTTAARQLKPVHALKLVAAIGLPAAILFGGSGRWDWVGAWVYLAFLIGGGTAAVRIMARLHPGLLLERAERFRQGKPWDKPFLLIIGLLGPSAVQLVAALDKRFRWSTPPPPFAQIAAGVVFVAGAALTAWAIAVNPFFSAVVRIQTDRGHAVVDRGPYAQVRHPGYVGMVLCTIASPVLLGTWWAFIPAILLAGAIAARTALEDRTLRAELGGYEQYSARVRSRLMPGLW